MNKKKEQCCGSCSNFLYEDILGKGNLRIDEGIELLR